MRNVREIQNVQETWIWQWRRWLFWHIIEFDRWEDDHSVIFSNLGGGEDDHSDIEKLCYVVWRLLLLCCFADQHYTVAPARRRTSAHCRRRPACGFCPHQYTRSILYYLAHQHRLIQEEIRVDLPFRIVSIVFQTGAGAGFRSHLCDGEGRKEGRKGAVLSVRRGWTLWQQQRLHQCSRQDNNNRKSLVLSLLLPISCRIFESFLLLFAFSLTGTAILSEEGALLCCVAWEVSAACIVLIRAYCEIIDRSVQRRRAAGVSILCCFRKRCSYERLVSLRRCSLLCLGLSAIACTQQRSCSTRVYRRHGRGSPFEGFEGSGRKAPAPVRLLVLESCWCSLWSMCLLLLVFAVVIVSSEFGISSFSVDGFVCVFGRNISIWKLPDVAYRPMYSDFTEDLSQELWRSTRFVHWKLLSPSLLSSPIITIPVGKCCCVAERFRILFVCCVCASIPKHRRRWPWSIQIRRQQRLRRRKHQWCARTFADSSEVQPPWAFAPSATRRQLYKKLKLPPPFLPPFLFNLWTMLKQQMQHNRCYYRKAVFSFKLWNLQQQARKVTTRHQSLLL